MRKRKSRDRPGKTSVLDIVIAIIAVLGILAAVSMLGGLGGLFGRSESEEVKEENEVDDSTDDPSDGSTDTGNDNTGDSGSDDPPEEEDPVEPVANYRGSGLYAAADGVLTYTYVGDTTADGYDLGFTKTVGLYEGNDSRVTTVDGDACWEISRSNVTESKVNVMQFIPVNQYGSKYVFETDILWEGCTQELNNGDLTGWKLRFEFVDSNGITLHVYGNSDETGVLHLVDISGSKVYMTVPKDAWSNIRFEVYGGSMHFYLNGEKVHEESVYEIFPGYDELSGDFSYGEIENRCFSKDLLYKLDNTYVSAITE